jgi:hypothetical protein
MSKGSERPSIVIRKVRDKADYAVPDVCIHCGSPVSTKKQVLLRCPTVPWVVYIAALFIAEMLETKISIVIPLCSKHESAWDANHLMKLITVFLVIPFVIVGIIIVAISTNRGEDVPISIVCMTASAIAGWLLIRAARARRFYGKSVDEIDLTLIGVSPAFAAAVSAAQEKSDARPVPASPAPRLQVTTMDGLVSVLAECDLDADLVAKVPAGESVRLGTATQAEDGRRWVGVTLPNGASGFALLSTIRSHCRLTDAG